MSQPLIERPDPGISQRFRDMAARIDHNADAKFGGCAVIYPPEGGGEPIEILLIDSSGNPAQFWATIQSRITVLLQDLQDKARIAQGMGFR